MVMNAAAGIQSVNRHHINIIRVMGADRGAILRKIVLPTMMPFLVLGLCLSIPEAMTGAIIGEFISASHGLGYLVYSASNELNMAVAMAAIIVLVGAVGVCDILLGVVEQRIPWQPPNSRTIGSTNDRAELPHCRKIETEKSCHLRQTVRAPSSGLNGSFPSTRRIRPGARSKRSTI